MLWSENAKVPTAIYVRAVAGEVITGKEVGIVTDHVRAYCRGLGYAMPPIPDAKDNATNVRALISACLAVGLDPL